MFSDELKKARLLSGLSGRETAKEAGISSAYYSQLETGARSRPPENLCKRLASILKTDFSVNVHADHATNNGGTQAIGNGISVGGEAACAESLARIEAKLDALALDMAVVKRLLTK